MRFRLCSSSPTRSQILREAGIAHTVSALDVDEDINERDPVKYVYGVAKAKMEAAVLKYKPDDMPLITADSAVVVGEQVLKKPKDRAEAEALLGLQSGADMRIITAMFVVDSAKRLEDVAVTRYMLKPFDPEALRCYLDSEEWRGKSGGCMVEGFCKRFIQSVAGYESTARGLCVENLKAFWRVA